MEAFLSPPESEIKFVTFTNFSLSMFRLIFYNFDPPKPNATWRERIQHHSRTGYTIFSIISIALACLSVLTSVILNIKNLTGNSFSIDNAPENAAAYLIVTIKFLVIFHYKKEFREIMAEMNTIFNERTVGYRKYGVKIYFDSFLRITKIYTIIMIVASLQNISDIIPYLINGSVRMTIEYWFPFDINGKYFLFAWLFSIWIVWNIGNFILAFDTLFCGLMTVITMEFDFLKMDMMDLGHFSSHERKQKIQKLIERHIRLLNLSDKFQKIYSTVFFVNLFLTAMILCFTIFQLAVASDGFVIVFYICFLGIVGGQTFLLCFYGQKLIDSSQSIAEGIYNCDWDSIVDNNFKKEIILVMIQSQKSKRFTALNFADISLPSFNTVSFLIMILSFIF